MIVHIAKSHREKIQHKEDVYHILFYQHAFLFAGCTANVVLITPDWTYCANAGDSRAIACIDGKTPFELSKDHKP